MDDDSQATLLTVLILLGLAAFFALTETAISSVSKNRIKVASDKGDPRAENALFVLEHFEKAITTLLICTNIVHICAASVVTVYVTRRWGLSAVSLSTVITTIVLFFAGEMVPKSIGKKNSFSCTLGCAGILKACMWLCTPFSAVLTGISGIASDITKEEPEVTVTEDELYDIIEDMEEEGTIDGDQSDLFSSALQFSDVVVDSILTPRVDMVAIDIDDAPEKIHEFIRGCSHSRIPVYEETPDHIIGVLQIRKYMKAYLKENRIPEIRPLLDKVYYAHQGTGIDELLENMSRQKISLAVITDSYGGTLGIVTVEDILEELVGEIWDEDDTVEEPMVLAGENTALISADETVGDALDFVGIDPEAEDEEAFTNLLVGEWTYLNFSEMPETGDSFIYKNLKVTIEEMDGNRIVKVRMDVLPEEGGSDD